VNLPANAAWWTALNGVDIAMIMFVLLSVAVGLWRGLVFEVLSLMSWLLAWVLAQAYAVQVASYLPSAVPGAALRHSVGFGLTFVMTLVVCGLAARLARMLVAATPLDLLDRLLGGLFGALRGLVVLLVATTLLALTPLARSVPWQTSHGAFWLQELLSALRPAVTSVWPRQLST
jgi:membrane protein required for colicin V production